jgi:hypothetical protein
VGLGTGAGWIILALVFVDEVLAAAAGAVWGGHVQGAVFGTAVVVVVVAVWWVFASPKAPLGGRIVRPVTKTLVFGLASLGLWASGHPGWAIGFLAFSVVVNGLAQLRSVQALVAEVPAD